MRGPQRGDHAQTDTGRLLGREGPAVREQVGERGSRHVLHDDAGPTVTGAAPDTVRVAVRVAVHMVVHDVMDDDHVRVRDPGRAPGLAARAFVQGDEVVGRQMRLHMQPLHRDLAVEDLVPGPPHRAHATAAYLLREPVAPGDEPPYVRHHVPSASPAYVRFASSP